MLGGDLGDVLESATGPVNFTCALYTFLAAGYFLIPRARMGPPRLGRVRFGPLEARGTARHDLLLAPHDAELAKALCCLFG